MSNKIKLLDLFCGGGGAYEFLCDFPVKKLKTKWKTCDAKLCDECTKKGASGETDFCPEHYELAKAAAERRANKNLK